MLTSSHSSAMTEDEESGARRDFNLLAQVTYLLKSLGQEMGDQNSNPGHLTPKSVSYPLYSLHRYLSSRATIVNVFYVYASRIFLRIFMTSYIAPSQQPHEVCNMDKQGK